jgi:hypothetical protein
MAIALRSERSIGAELLVVVSVDIAVSLLRIAAAGTGTDRAATNSAKASGGRRAALSPASLTGLDRNGPSSP